MVTSKEIIGRIEEVVIDGLRSESADIKKVTDRQLGAIVGMTKTTVGRWKNDKRKRMDVSVIARMMAAYPQVNPRWLLLGAGPKYQDFQQEGGGAEVETVLSDQSVPSGK